jgi:hypothetical protein
MRRILLPQDLKDRQPVWEALSEFWLDTELQEFQLNDIARVLAQSPYSFTEIKAIHLYEVAPSVSANVFSTAGVWSGFDANWLLECCKANVLRRDSVLWRARQWLQRPVVWFFTAHYWRQIAPRVQALRRSAAESGKDGCLARPPDTTVPTGPHRAVHERGAQDERQA